MLKRSLVLIALLASVATACGGEPEAEPLTPAQASRYFTNIDSLLDQVVAEHEQGNTAEAAELAGEAYLENFEYLEHDLEEADRELNERLEGLLGPEFRRQIQEGMSQQELEARVARVRDLLEQAKTALGVS
jgi:hypothetical protein